MQDIYCLDADGALFDAALLSAVAAFSHCKCYNHLIIWYPVQSLCNVLATENSIWDHLVARPTPDMHSRASILFKLCTIVPD